MADQPASLAAALAALQADLPHVGKDASAVVPTKAGGTYGYKYADLATITRAIMPRLAALGLAFVACPDVRDGKPVLHYMLMHSSNSDVISGDFPLSIRQSDSPQAYGSAITYARRYCLCAVTGVAPDEDDDDAAAAESEYRAQRNRPPEVDQHGAATFAEQTRMVTGPVPGATRHERVPEGDAERFAAGPNPAQVRGSRMNQMFALFAQLKIREREAQVAELEAIVGHPLESRADLNLSELTTVCAILRRRAEQEEHAA